MKSNDYILLDGTFIKDQTPAVPVTSRGLMYGDGCFDTLRSYSGHFLHLESHLKRLNSTSDLLGFTFPEELKIGRASENIHSLLEKNNLTDRDAVVRIQLWREGGRGYSSAMPSPSHWSIVISSMPELKKNISLSTVSTRRIPNASLPVSHKLSNNLNYILAAREANKAGADDALMLTIDDFISETTIANIFWVRENQLFTPSEQCDLLPGITRQIIIELAKSETGLNIRQGKYPLQELYQAEGVFACNSVREIVTVSSIDDNKFSQNHSAIAKLKTDLEHYKSSRLD